MDVKEQQEYSNKYAFEQIQQMLIENIAYFLDSEEILTQELMACIKDPKNREDTDLHIRMAKAAMEIYKQAIETTLK